MGCCQCRYGKKGTKKGNDQGLAKVHLKLLGRLG